MGANAQTSVPTFTAGQVLTAAQMNDSARTGVPVFADASARDAAFGGTGEKTLAEGQLAYLEDSDIVQYYDGSSWATVGPSSVAGLVYLTGAAFTAATSFSLPDNTFSATYRNYRLIVQITTLTSDADFTIRLRASGADNSTSNYDTMMSGIGNGGSASNQAIAAGSSWGMSELDSAQPWYEAVVDICAPQVATSTHMLGNIVYVQKNGASDNARSGGGIFRQTTQFDSLSFISSVASSMTGIYRVYGYADS